MKKLLLSTAIISFNFYYGQNWSTSGNAGTDPNTNFVGTSDNQSLVFRVNNSEKLRLSPNGRLTFFNSNLQTYSNNLYIGGGNEIPSNNAGGVNWANTAVGLGSMVVNMTGSANTAVGFNSLASSLDPFSNTAIGVNAMQSSTKGNYNVAVGGNALNSLFSGDANVAVGNAAMGGGNTTGTANIAVGDSPLRYMGEGDANIVLGRRGISHLNQGSHNIGIGDYVANNLSRGDNNIYIGNNISATSPVASNELNIGNWIYGIDGQIAIGGPASLSCSDCSKYSLFVKNGIRTEQIKVDIASAAGWADYVFDQGYRLQTLRELAKQISDRGHLPGIPSKEEVLRDGVNLGDMDARLLAKIEELTLYAIGLDSKNLSLEAENRDLRKAVESLAGRVRDIEAKTKH